MFFDETRETLLALLQQPLAVAAAVVLAGVNAALWLLVMRRVGCPTGLAPLMLLPPLNFVLPLYVAFARWPGQRPVRIATAPRNLPDSARTGLLQRADVRRVHTGSGHGDLADLGEFGDRWHLKLAPDGLPRFRIPLPPSSVARYGNSWLDDEPQGRAL